jgi:hypothetical protein
MVAGRRFWIAIWFGILLLGMAGLGASIYWGRHTQWKNVDELLRGAGTVAASAGMLLLLFGILGWAGQVLLLAALVCFVLAFVWGRKHPLPPRGAQQPKAGPPPGAA